jgi:hypothetical protein
MGVAQACSDVPIDAADIVAGLIGPNLAWFGTMSRSQTTVISLKQSIETTSHADFKTAENFRRRGSVDRRC